MVEYLKVASANRFFYRFFNDLAEKNCNSYCFLIADDCKQMSPLTKPDIQLDTDHFSQKAEENRTEYNNDKCKSTTFQGNLA